jgi:3-methyladenine DNA glycosylase AlkC
MSAGNQPLKESLGGEALGRIARSIKGVQPAFDERAFLRAATEGLDELELKARVLHVIKALRGQLPRQIPQAIKTLVRAGERWEPGREGDPLSGFAAWPVVDFIGEHGLEHYDLSMDALRRLTPLWTAEFAIRPFIERYPRQTLETLHDWAGHPDQHVRRLVSEGTRPRLPWGARLRCFQRDPAPVLALLEKLKDDPEETVRRSVANSLNDISKDHPGLAVEVAERWMAEAKGSDQRRRWVVRHALRGLIKAGHPGALRVLGYDPRARLEIAGLKVAPAKLKLGEDLCITFSIISRARAPQRLVVDYALHLPGHIARKKSAGNNFAKDNGARRRKVFKIRNLTLAPGEDLTMAKIHKFRQITTRRHYAGRHAVEIIVNGASRAQADFDLVL